MKQYGMAVIGLGVVGRRMLEQAGRHRGFRVVAAFDSVSAARSEAAASFPGLPIVARARDAVERLDVDVVYVAVPPLAHAEYVRAAHAAGKAVFCEKPLGIDLAEGAALVELVSGGAAAGGVVAGGVAPRSRHAVNFVFASSAAVEALRRVVTSRAFGLRAVEIQMRFFEWPRAWQAGATWLRRADQGGFTREVLSHYVYLLLRLFGDATLLGACTQRSSAGAAETASVATLRCAGVPVAMQGSVGGQPPDVVEARFVGASRELRLRNWYELVEHVAEAPGGRPVAGLPEDPRGASYQAQLTQLHAMVAGKAHGLPDFETAWRVQQIIEEILT
jgi:predicted dehydrogenase